MKSWMIIVQWATALAIAAAGWMLTQWRPCPGVSFLHLFLFLLAAMWITPLCGTLLSKKIPSLAALPRRSALTALLVAVALMMVYSKCLQEGNRGQQCLSLMEGVPPSESEAPVPGERVHADGTGGDAAVQEEPAQPASGEAESTSPRWKTPDSEKGRDKSSIGISDETGVPRSARDKRSGKETAGAVSKAQEQSPRSGTRIKDSTSHPRESSGQSARTADGAGKEQTPRRRVVPERGGEADRSRTDDYAVQRRGAEKKIALPDGSTYSGSIVKGKPDGQGTIEISKSDAADVKGGQSRTGRQDVAAAVKTYMKQWAYDGKPDGGDFIRKYSGTWKNGLPAVRGFFAWQKGDSYSGEFQQGKRSGTGTYTYAHGTKYNGRWREDMANGRGSIVWVEGDRYEGTWVADSREGHGVYLWADGTKYEGQWSRDKINGKGSIVWANGNSYTGDWIDNVRTGKGTYRWKNGDVYSGVFAGNKRNGQGTYRWINGTEFSGSWQNGLMHGYGKITYRDGKSVHGTFRMNEMVKGDTNSKQ